MLEKRGVLGLSIDILVILIISLVILGAGVILLYTFIGGAKEIKSELDQRTAQELERLLVDQGQQVALPFHSATVFRGENHVFGIGILNIKPESEFRVVVDLSGAFNEQNKPIEIYDKDRFLQEWLLYDQEGFYLEENQHRQEAILVTIPKEAERGKYIFVARVLIFPFDLEDPDSKYGKPQTFFVKVE